MKNILIIINPEKLSVSDVEFGCYMANLSGSRLTGVFLENQAVGDVPALKAVLGIPYVETIVASDLPGYHERASLFEDNIRAFNEICIKHGVQTAVHKDRAVPIKEVKSESRFADLLIINSSMHFDDEGNGEFSAFVGNVLVLSECPVLVSPAIFNGIDEIVFTYDGSAAAAFAIRQFTNIFPELDEEKITVVQVKKHLESADEKNLKQYLRLHYSTACFDLLNGDTSQELFSFLSRRKKALVVMGAYSRSRISRSFFPSTAEILIQTLSLPIFIAHP